jgi:hypothetical protein
VRRRGPARATLGAVPREPDGDPLPTADARNRTAVAAVDPDVNSATATPPPAAWYPGSVDRRLRQRRGLTDVVLAGTRERWHVTVRWIVVGLAALTALIIATERHRVCDAWGSCDASDWGPSHTLVSDVGGTPFVLLAFLVTLQFFGRRARLLGSAGSALGSAVLAVYLVATCGMAHFLSKVEGDDGAVMLCLATFAACLFQLVLEPILAAGMRRALERNDPEFPRAAVVPR